jgi:YD repeat-containing protein
MLRELDTRAGDGITITLYWDSFSRRTIIHLLDKRTEIDATFQVPHQAAADAFEHPFCYLASTSIPDSLGVEDRN